jgi:hypothetical protein
MKKLSPFVISDRRFSMIERTSDLFGAHNAAGLNISGSFDAPPQADQIMAANNGGGIMSYIIGHDEGIGRRLTENLQKTTFAGMKQAPDAVMTFHWTDDENLYGTRGQGSKIGG